MESGAQWANVRRPSVLPYYANDLDRFPLADVAIGYPDPRDLWPYDTALGGGPLMPRPAGPCGVLMALAVALGILVWLLSPFGVALMQWWLD
jgi:hypothetical protein